MPLLYGPVRMYEIHRTLFVVPCVLNMSGRTERGAEMKRILVQMKIVCVCIHWSTNVVLFKSILVLHCHCGCCWCWKYIIFSVCGQIVAIEWNVKGPLDLIDSLLSRNKRHAQHTNTSKYLTLFKMYSYLESK